MESKQIDVACPCCQSRILVDVRTGKVLRTLRPEELDSSGKPLVSDRDWEQALGRVRGREEQKESKLDDALTRERERSKKLEDLFREARDKLDSDDEGPDA